jgi:carbon monoxide dehydrogenase subunit G
LYKHLTDVSLTLTLAGRRSTTNYIHIDKRPLGRAQEAKSVPVLREQLQTDLPIEEAFAFVADFANASRWDPGVASAERSDGAGPARVGTRYRLGVRAGGRVVPMEYRIVELEPARRVVLSGRGSGVSAIDDIRFEARGGRTHIDYIADIRLTGFRRLLSPFAGSTFARIARDAREGMQRTLDELSRGLASRGPRP